MGKARLAQVIALAGILAIAVLLGFAGRRFLRRSAPPSPTPLPKPTRLVFYVVAHQDDWELFRGEVAYRDLASATTRSIFIHTTAGDAGETDGLWEAREQGSIAAMRAVGPPEPLTIETASVRSHPIVCYRVGQSVDYFLRLPDGNMETGKGYEEYGNQSLAQLRDASKPIRAVDGSTSYPNWEDFWRTIEALMSSEQARMPGVAPLLNASDYSVRCNPKDHTDHVATGAAVREFASGRYDRVWFVGYDVEHRRPNLRSADVRNKRALFRAYSAMVLELTTRNGEPVRPDDENWRLYGSRSYSRSVPRGRPDVDDPRCAVEPGSTR